MKLYNILLNHFKIISMTLAVCLLTACQSDGISESSSFITYSDALPISTVSEELKPETINKIICTSESLWDMGTGFFHDGSLTVYADGRLIFETIVTPSDKRNSKDREWSEITTAEYVINDTEFTELVKVLNQERFLGIPDDISDYDVCDGGSNHIEVVTDTQTYRKGGANPHNEEFLTCLNSVYMLLYQKMEERDYILKVEVSFWDRFDDISLRPAVTYDFNTSVGDQITVPVDGINDLQLEIRSHGPESMSLMILSSAFQEYKNPVYAAYNDRYFDLTAKQAVYLAVPAKNEYIRYRLELETHIPE